MIQTFYLYYILNALTGVIKKYIISNTKGFYFIQVLSDVRFLLFISSVLSLMMEYTWLNWKIQRNFPEDISCYIIIQSYQLRKVVRECWTAIPLNKGSFLM